MRPWRIAPKTDTEHFTRVLRVHPAIAQVFVNRGMDLNEAKVFINNERLLHDPRLLPDVEKAIQRLQLAKERQENVVVYRDYDVDGTMGGAIMFKGLKRFGLENVRHFAPNRFETGYGLHKDLIEKLADEGATLIVTVDCGTTSVEEVEHAKSLGVDVIVTDHHEPGEILPDAVAVINPKVAHSLYPYREICGATVAWKVVQALLGQDCMEYIDLVATATVADVVPLRNENRWIVKEGLKLLNSNEGNLGLRKLVEVAGFTGKVDSFAIGFGIGPRINAVGRLGDANAVLELFLTDEETRAEKMAQILDKLNDSRRSLVDDNMHVAETLLPSQWNPDTDRIIVVASPDFHQGVIGIVAGKLLEKYQRPTIVIAIEEDKGMGKASCRSFGPVHLHQTLSKVSHLLLKFGGHAAAAGFSIEINKIDEFRRAINDAVTHIPMDEFAIPVEIDAVLDLEEVDDYLVAQMELLTPYGEGNPMPLFAVRNVRVKDIRILKDKHLKLVVEDMVAREAMFFNRADVVQNLGLNVGDFVDLAFRPMFNEFRGSTSILMEVEDVRLSEDPFIRDIQQGIADPSAMTPRELGRLLFGVLAGKANEVSEDYDGIEEAEMFHTKIAGVSFGDRQEVARSLSRGDVLNVVREPDHPIDPNAIGLYTQDGRHVGYFNAMLAAKLAPVMDSGVKYTAIVDVVTGGDEGNHVGVNIIVQKLDVDVEDRVERTSIPLPPKLSFEAPTKTEIAWEALETVRQTLLGPHPYRPKQMEAIQATLRKESTLVVMGTGRGKSAIFQTVAAYNNLVHGEKTIIFYPLRALLNDQFAGIQRKLAPLGIRTEVASGSLNASEREALFSSLDEVDILLATPEFVIYHKDRFKGFLEKVSLVVIDECHHIADDRFGYRHIGDFIRELGATALLVTATVDDAAFKKISESIAPANVIIDNHERTNLHVIDRRGERNKEQYIIDLLDKGEKTLIFCNSRQQTVSLAKTLRQHLMRTGEQDRIAYYHGGLDQEVRHQIERAFADGTLRVVVATSAFGEGVDIGDIRHIVHYHLPLNQTAFLQMSGRAGRDGQDAWVHILFGDADKHINRMIVEEKYPSRETLTGIIRGLVRIANGRKAFRASNEEIQAVVTNLLNRTVSIQSIETALKVFEELDLIRIDWSAGRLISIQELKKSELHEAVVYSEAVRDRRAYEDYLGWIDKASVEDIRGLITRPYFPALERIA